MAQRMIELIRRGAVPESVLKAASRGGLSLPLPENIEILVHLTTVPQLAEAARETLASTKAEALMDVVRDEDCPREVLAYFLRGTNRRQELLPMLVEHRSVPPAVLVGLLESATQRELQSLLPLAKVQQTPELLAAAQRNPAFPGAQVSLGEAAAEIVDESESAFVAEHGEEIRAEENDAKPFSLVSEQGGAVTAEQATEDAEPERLSLLQKLARMSVGERVKTAMRGGREERAILIRDGSRIVSSAVVASPKLSEQEVETFAALKNVQESVLRDIARNRKFLKSYPVVKALVNNPRCPLDLALGMAKFLTPIDLKHLSTNKNVSETLRKLAHKMAADRAAKKE